MDIHNKVVLWRFIENHEIPVYHFQYQSKISPFLKCKCGVTFVRRCFHTATVFVISFTQASASLLGKGNFLWFVIQCILI